MRQHFDLIVVGAGVLGTFHAYHAARLGQKVLLTEKDQHPVNATVRNFGQAVPSGMSSEWFDYGRRGTEIFQEIQKEFDISVRNNGSVYVASDDDEAGLINELKSIMDARGYESHLFSSQQCLEKWPALRKDYCQEGIFFPQEVSIEPDRMIYKVLEYCQGKFDTLTYRPRTTVIACEVSGQIVKITTHDGQQYSAEKVIVCNGGEFKLLFADLFHSSGIVVSKLQMLRTAPFRSVPLDGNILTGLTIRRYESFEECPSFSSIKTPPHLSELKKWGIHILFKKAIDGSIIIGDSHEYADLNHSDNLGFHINQHINELILQEAERIVTFNVRDIASSWAGFYPQHPDKNIVEYDIEDRIHIRTAIGGKGITSGAGYAEASIQRLFNLS
jgi:FAD dependent oxidoreductase TIGR03364